MWSVRRVDRADEDAWVRLCTASVGPDDYVLNFLDHFLERATTYVALEGDRFVGTMTYTELLDGAAWLSAARTLPEYRGRGVAVELMRALESLARSRGRSALRLWTAASNTAGVAAFRKGGFRELARFSRMEAMASGAIVPSPLTPLRVDDRLWDRLRTSEILVKSKDYVSYDYGFIRLNRDLLGSLREAGVLVGRGENAAVVSGASEGYVEESLELSVLAGNLASLLGDARAHAATLGRARVETFLPHDPGILEVARRTGFTNMDWGEEAILCEKPLGPAPVR
jgi:ribosomal protein S18 acetylase RimI-like enzyme